MKKLFSTRYSDTQISLSLFILRIVFGGLMLFSGCSKLQNFNSVSENFVTYFGVSSKLWLILVIFAELFCAALIVLGLLTRLAAVPLIITMAVAFFVAHNGQLTGEHNGQIALMYLAAYIVIFLAGPGKYSADKAMGK